MLEFSEYRYGFGKRSGDRDFIGSLPRLFVLGKKELLAIIAVERGDEGMLPSGLEPGGTELEEEVAMELFE